MISNWKHDTKTFVEYSRRVQEDLHIKKTLNSGVDINELASEDQYDEIEKYIITQLIEKINSNLISLNDVEVIIKQREQSFFYEASLPFYETILNGAKLQWEIESLKDKISIDDLESWGDEYSKRLYKVDLHYRNFIHSYKQTQQNPVLQNLFDKYHNLYSNDWLLPLNDNWQKTVDRTDTWNTTPGKRQRDFYYYNVKPLIDKGQKAVVIISDALRYEIGVDLNDNLNAEMVYESKIDHLYSELPSYTQLGMASLLPNSELEIKNDCNVLIDGMNSDGTPNRSKILTKNSGVQSLAISYKEFMKLNSGKEGRELLKENKLVYIYHNKIDKTGDDKATEEDVFDAVNHSITELKELLKRLYNMNSYNYFITSDHGFIYQAKELEESDFIESSTTGDIWKQNRRFFIGKNLENHSSYKEFTANELGQNGDYTCMFPKSINRVRVKGAGSKFVHGGTSLQEVIIPVLRINRKREAIRSLVDIDIIKGKEEISSSIKPISFIQSKPIGDKLLPRRIKAAFYNHDKTVIISEEFEYTFDSTDSLERQREKKFTYHLSNRATDEFNNQKVVLVLQEAIDGTSGWKEYSTYDFRMSMSSTMDFDF
ncbi:BREX-1 system phosphatase PglZ type A [Thiospirochaeta perfilievii]|uniref:BREX-1 system phosphatase PglZ type A n=1 Tax=Thiospirochaeta perfilievii TaxID=252967 RepID=A0A5C1Q7M8_9SPIO|nr:BREX-1 system phosphatase PglZ type A [Thiospirochaeta perfilievii]QEN04083.1 BREX-1 system phosphatase PglZ type A [Thiospirochaeta perfilievii]